MAAGVPAAIGAGARVPVAHPVPPTGGGEIVAAGTGLPVAKRVDGAIDDWQGQPSGFGGTALYSAGELVYQDHLFDAYGAAEAHHAQTVRLLDQLADVPGVERAEGLSRYAGFVAETNGGPVGAAFATLTDDLSYGALDHQDAADLLEVRVAVSERDVTLLTRTTAMTDEARPAVLVLADVEPGRVTREIPFGTGLFTDEGDVAVLLSGGRGTAVDLTTGAVTDVAAATDTTGYTNAVETALPRALVQGPGGLRLAVAAALDDGGGGLEVANVAFRQEPFRPWWDRQQALALHDGTIDPFFVDVDVHRLTSGVIERYRPGPGYHERIFTSTEQISAEEGRQGLHQHYGLYLPAGHHDGEPAPLTLYLHGSGSPVHTEPYVIPGLVHDFGEARGNVMVFPSGRDPDFSMYAGASHLDVLQVLDDLERTVTVDPARRYVAGYSMGGWGAFLYASLYPDRFAAAAPMAGAVTAADTPTGLDVEDCDRYRIENHTPCYVGHSAGEQPAEWDVRRMFANVRHVPVVMYQGGADSNVLATNAEFAARRLTELGFRHRLYRFPPQDHYVTPAVDEWGEAARYLDRFTLDPRPARVTYVRDLVLETNVEAGIAPPRGTPGYGLQLNADGAYWVDALEPSDPVAGRAEIDARSLAIGDPAVTTEPEAGGPSAPGQTGPYVMTGLAWREAGPGPALANGFEAALRGTAAVHLDVLGMAISADVPLTGVVDSEDPFVLGLRGDWRAKPAVTIDGSPAESQLRDGVLSVELPAGRSTLLVCPRGSHAGPASSACVLRHNLRPS